MIAPRLLLRRLALLSLALLAIATGVHAADDKPKAGPPTHSEHAARDRAAVDGGEQRGRPA